MSNTSKRILRVLGLLLIVACWAAVFIAVWNVPGNHQWDLRSYDNASHALELGLNPYVKANLVRAAGPLKPNPLPFIIRSRRCTFSGPSRRSVIPLPIAFGPP